MIKIKSASNGATVQIDSEEPEVFIFDKDNLEGLLELLYCIRNYFELQYGASRYDEERVDIKIGHGDKVDCKDKKCEICKGDAK